MIDFLIWFISSIGIGELFSRLDKSGRVCESKCAFLGYLSIYIILFVENLVFKLPLRQSAICLFALAFPLACLNIYRFARSQNNEKLGKWPHYFIFIISVVFIIVFQIKYMPHKWDEFSHWALMPKMIFLANEVVSTDFPYKSFLTYTPGWSLFLSYPSLLAHRTFQSQNLVFGSFASSLFFLGFIWRWMTEFYFGSLTPKLIHRLAGIVLVLICLFGLAEKPFPYHVLIENPQIQLVTSLLLLAYSNIQSKNFNTLSSFHLGVMFCAGYLLKKPFLVMAPALIIWIGLAFYLRRQSEHFSYLTIIKWCIFLFVPTALSYYVWQNAIQIYEPAWYTISVSNPLEWDPLLQSSRYDFLWRNFPTRILSYIFSPNRLVLLFIFCCTLYKHRCKIVSWFLVGYGVCIILFTIGLFNVYLNGMSSPEVERFASFDRYMHFMFKPLFTFSLLFCVKKLLRNEKFQSIIFKNNKKLQIIFTLMVLIYAFSVWKMFNKINNYPLLEPHYQPMKHTNHTPNDTLKVLLIAQKDDGFYRIQARYLAVSTSLKPDFIVNEQYKFDNPTLLPSNTEDASDSLNSALKNTDIIWIIQSDELINAVLEKFQNENPALQLINFQGVVPHE